jgi:hypothetical protein
VEKVVTIGTGSIGGGFRDSIRKEHVALGFDPRIAWGLFFGSCPHRDQSVSAVDHPAHGMTICYCYPKRRARQPSKDCYRRAIAVSKAMLDLM